MKNIQEDIKSGQFQTCISALRRRSLPEAAVQKHNLVKALNPDGDTMNFARYEGKGIDIRELDKPFVTPCLFLRIEGPMLLEDTGFFKNKCEELADYMKNPCRIISIWCSVESEVDKRSRMYKAVKACGQYRRI